MLYNARTQKENTEGIVRSLTVELAALDLDLNNPRIDPASHQTEAMNSILMAESVGDRVGEKLFALAKSICELESTDPSERLMVIANVDHPGRYTVLDGNRRVTALKLLTEPSLLDREDLLLSPSLRRRMHALRNEYDIESIRTSIDVSVFPDRDAAHPFIQLKHTGERDGAGRSAWSPMQQARFENAGSYQLLLRLREDHLLNADTSVQIDDSSFPISTFLRAGDSTEFFTRFGGRISSDGYDEGNSPALAIEGWARVANDTANGRINSRSINATEAIRDYLDEVLASLRSPEPEDHAADEEPDAPSAVPPIESPAPGADSQQQAPGKPSTGEVSGPDHAGTAGAPDGDEILTTGVAPPAAGQTPGEPAPSPNSATAGNQADPGTATSTPPASPSPTTTTTTTKQQRRPKQTLLDRRSLIPISNAKCRKIQEEMLKVKVTEAPYACALLIRSLLELTAHVYLVHFSLPLPANLTSKIDALSRDMLSHTRMQGEPADRIQIATSLGRDGKAYENLSDAAHNVYTALSPEHVRATWDSVAPGLRLAWQRIGYVSATS